MKTEANVLSSQRPLNPKSRFDTNHMHNITPAPRRFAVSCRLACPASLFLAGLLALTGCSSVKTQVDTGRVTARTFAFMDPGPRKLPASAESRAHVHTMIQEAITKNLAAKGVSRVATGADLTVAYLFVAGNNVATTSLNEYFGYGPEAAELVEKVHEAQTVKDTNRSYFEAGTLIIDILDAKTGKLLKRASVHGEILRDITPDVRQARIQEFVDQALQNLRIAN